MWYTQSSIFFTGERKYCHISNRDPKIILIDKYGENPIFPNVVTPVNFLIGFQTNLPEFKTWRGTICTMKNGQKRAISRRWASKELTLGRGERYRANRCQVNYVFRNKEEDKKPRDVYIYIYIRGKMYLHELVTPNFPPAKGK